MADKKTAVFGIYSTRNGAEQAAEALVNAGLQRETFPSSCRKISARAK